MTSRRSRWYDRGGMERIVRPRTRFSTCDDDATVGDTTVHPRNLGHLRDIPRSVMTTVDDGDDTEYDGDDGDDDDKTKKSGSALGRVTTSDIPESVRIGRPTKIVARPSVDDESTIGLFFRDDPKDGPDEVRRFSQDGPQDDNPHDDDQTLLSAPSVGVAENERTLPFVRLRTGPRCTKCLVKHAALGLASMTMCCR